MSEPKIEVVLVPMTAERAGSCTWGPGQMVTFVHERETVELRVKRVGPEESAWDSEREMRTRAMDLVLIAGAEAFKRGDLAVSKALMAIAEQIQRLAPKSRPT